MSNIFISYRRADSQDVVGRIYDRLTTHFPRNNVLKDVDSIPLGQPFPQYVQHMLSETNIVLVVIGDEWLEASNEAGERRLHRQEDWVRIEIESALNSDAAVIPITVGGAKMPKPEQVPESIRQMCFHNAIAIRPDPDFHRDMDRLIDGMAELRALPRRKGEPLTTNMVLRLVGRLIAYVFFISGMIAYMFPTIDSESTDTTSSRAGTVVLSLLTLALFVPDIVVQWRERKRLGREYATGPQRKRYVIRGVLCLFAAILAYAAFVDMPDQPASATVIKLCHAVCIVGLAALLGRKWDRGQDWLQFRYLTLLTAVAASAAFIYAITYEPFIPADTYPSVIVMLLSAFVFVSLTIDASVERGSKTKPSTASPH